jgi:hypothetical protein
MRCNNIRELVFVKEDIVVGWLACAENPRVAIEVIVELYRTDDIRVDDRPGRTVPTAVGIALRCGEEYYFVVFANDNERNFWFEANSDACVCVESGKTS